MDQSENARKAWTEAAATARFVDRHGSDEEQIPFEPTYSACPQHITMKPEVLRISGHVAKCQQFGRDADFRSSLLD